MFKRANCEAELWESMEQSLVTSQTEEQLGLIKLAKALDLLNSVATILDQIGMIQEAGEIEQILKDIK